jgi:hypothetical protein
VPNRFTATDIVHRVVAEGLGALVAPRGDGHGFVQPDGFESIGDEPIADEQDRVVAVPWEWRGVHVEALLGVASTQRDVVVRGVTLVTGEEGAELLHRYIDWADVLQQLGARVFGRPLVDVVDRWGDEVPEVEELSFLRRPAGEA